METKEERLKKIVQRLDVKVQSVLTENKELKQRLELAQLDQQLAEEQAQQCASDLQKLQQRNAELEELRQLSTELEDSLAREKLSLEAEIARLESELETVNNHTQSFESLKFELRCSERQARALKLNLEILKNGIAAALDPILGPIVPSWLPLIELLQIPVSPIIDEYSSGKISVTQLKEKLSNKLTDSFDRELNFENPNFDDESIFKISEKLRALQPTPELDRVVSKMDLVLEKRHEVKKSEEKKNRGSENGENHTKLLKLNEELSTELDSTRLRNLVLEEKLKQSQLLSDEIALLKAWQKTALEREAHFREQIASLQNQLTNRQAELDLQRRRNLPMRLVEQTHQNAVQELQKTIFYLSRSSSQSHLELTPLHRCSPINITHFAGNERLRKMRKAVLGLRLGGDPRESAKLALEQEILLLQI